MAAPSYTYTLTNGTTADASQVMQDFNDVLNGITDGTKDLTMNALTANGAANLKAAVTLGASSSNDLTVNGALATTIAIKTNTSFNIGSATKGLAGVYLGGTSTFTGKVAVATLAASRNFTIPDTGVDANFVMDQLAQTIAGKKSFNGGVVTGSGGTINATGDSNLGTIASVTFSKFYKGSFTGTFTGAFTSGTKTFNYIFVGSDDGHGYVYLTIPATNNTSSVGTILTSAAVIPLALRPATQCSFACQIINGTVQTSPGMIFVATSGDIQICKDFNSGTFASSGTVGSQNDTAVCYYI